MRAFLFAGFILLIGAEAVAQSIIVPHPVPTFRQRIDVCALEWNATPGAERGMTTYRQFATKCRGVGTARQISTVAACRNGTTAPATAREGACAYDGGVERWLD